MRISYLVTCVVATFLVHLGLATVPTCPYSWFPDPKNPNSTTCYLVTNKIKRSWTDAQTFCEYMDGTLLKIDSLSERTYIFNLMKQYHAGLPSHQEWWIGLHDNPSQTGVIWIDKTVPDQSLLPWSPSDAHYDHSKACVEYYNGTLRHQDCSSKQYFACERPKNSAIWCDALHGWENINNMCYKVQHKLMTWDDARSECQRNNADLFVGKDTATEAVLWNFLDSRQTDMWTGLKGYQSSAGDVTFRWGSSTGNAIQLGKIGQDFFGVQHPDQAVTSSNGSVSCVIANHTFTTPKLWQPTDCSTRSYSLCQKREGLCAAGWIKNRYKCYKIVTGPKLTWTGASAYCRSWGANLLKISWFDQTFVNSNLNDLSQQGIDSIWLGLTDYNQDGTTWKWADNSTYYSGSYMYNNLPGGNLPTNRPGQMDCFTIYTDDANGTWQLANNCSETKAFMCYLSVGVTPTPPVSPVSTPSPGVTPSTAIWSSECGLFWVKDNTTGYCYRFSDNTMTWFQAQAQCKSLGSGSQLASINTMHDQHFLGDRLFGYQSPALWIGVNNLNTGTGYHWTDGTPFGYLNWAPGEPNNINKHEHCGEMVTGSNRQGMWNDVDCSTRRGYICKKPSPGMTTAAMTTLPATPSGQFYGCPGNLWKPYKGNCFLFMKNGVSWGTATQYCVSKGGNLASIVDENEQNFVFSQLPGKIDRSQYWIGFNDMLSQMRFMWSDGSPIHYTNWAENEPNNWLNKNEDCVGIFLKDGTWNDETCENPQSGFICKAPKSLVPVGKPQANLGIGCSVRNALTLGYYCYLFQQSTKTWAAAQSDCQATGGNFAVVHDRYQQAFFASQIAGSGGNYWIGLGNGGTYKSTNWVTGESLDYTAWSANYTTANNTGSGQPICVAMKTQGPGVGLWISSGCATVNKYVCQYPTTGFSTQSTTTTTAPPTCPDGWHLNNGYCYKGYAQNSDKRTWFDARNFCEAMGSDLVSLHSSDEERFAFSYTVTQSYSYGASFWIGANDFDVEKGYKWTDGSVWNYKNWNAGEPNDMVGSDDCVEYNKNPGNWNDNNCYVAKPFVCKLQLGKQLQTVPTTVSPTLTASCAGSTGWYSFNDSCYYISPRYGVDSRKTWYDAKTYCMQQGGNLASVHSEQENGFITTLVSKTVGLNSWIGLTDLGVDNFGWVEGSPFNVVISSGNKGILWVDGSPFNYVAWSGANEPSDNYGQEKCGQMFAFNGYWNDNDCNEAFNFVCKRPQGTVHPHTPTPTALIAGGCPQGYTGVHKGNKCFKVIGAQQSDRMNYTDARDDCRAAGGDIASINSHIEQVTIINMINGLFADEIGLWIGLNNRNKHWKFTWQDSSPLLMTNWAKGEPAYAHYCVEMYTGNRRAGKWRAVDCSLVRGYICEITRNSTLPTAAPPQGTCSPGYLQSPQLDCLKVNTTSMSWAQAKASCQAEGASLVSILNVFDQAFVDIITADVTTPIWIGLADEMLTGTYSWVDNWGVYYTSWNKDEPTYTTGEGCVATQSGYWNDTMCANTYPFVCKKSFFKPPKPTAIPSGYCKDVTWKQFGDFCYYINIPGYKSWAQAETECKTLGMELASILSVNEENFILREIDNNPGRSMNVWIGFRKTNGFFSWTDSSTPSYIHWDDGEPSDLAGTRHEDCVELKHTNGKWNDKSCSRYNGYVCKTAKLPATSPPPTTTTISTTTQSTTTVSSTTNTLPTGFEPITAKLSTSGSSGTARSSTGVTKKSQGSSKQSSQGLSSPPRSSISQPQISSKPATVVTRKLLTPYHVTPQAKPQVEQQADLSSGQIAGIIIGVLLALVIICGLLIVLKNYSGSQLFNFQRLQGQGGFDNACYDKSNEEVSINDKTSRANGHSSKVANGNSLKFTDFGDHEYANA